MNIKKMSSLKFINSYKWELDVALLTSFKRSIQAVVLYCVPIKFSSRKKINLKYFTKMNIHLDCSGLLKFKMLKIKCFSLIMTYSDFFHLSRSFEKQLNVLYIDLLQYFFLENSFFFFFTEKLNLKIFFFFLSLTQVYTLFNNNNK
jgi:hypothetical protein